MFVILLAVLSGANGKYLRITFKLPRPPGADYCPGRFGKFNHLLLASLVRGGQTITKRIPPAPLSYLLITSGGPELPLNYLSRPKITFRLPQSPSNHLLIIFSFASRRRGPFLAQDPLWLPASGVVFFWYSKGIPEVFRRRQLNLRL